VLRSGNPDWLFGDVAPGREDVAACAADDIAATGKRKQNDKPANTRLKVGHSKTTGKTHEDRGP
jgi:hypothetical protein